MKPSHMLTRITTTLLLVLLVLPAATARPQGAWAAPALPANPTTACNGSGYMRQLTLTQTMQRSDDGIAGPYPLGFTINYFGVNFSEVYLSNNGKLTFGGSSGAYTPTGMAGLTQRTIAPFFADVDTRPTGSPNLVYFGQVTVDGRPAFAVHWTNVGYFSQHLDKTNDFMVIVIDRSDRAAGDWDFEFNFKQIQWETGDANSGSGGLGGTSAAIGYADGTSGANDYQAPGSLVPGSFLDSNPTTGAIHTALNSANCGQWKFQVVLGTPVTPTADISLEQEFNPQWIDSSYNPLAPSKMGLRPCVNNIGQDPVSGRITIFLNGQQVGQQTFTGLQPTAQKCLRITWDLGSSSGRLKNAELKVTAEIDGATDANPADNTHVKTVNIYWADFQAGRDGYSFENPGYSWAMFLQDLISLALPPHVTALLGLNPLQVFDGHGGQCFGMSSTSLFYATSQLTRPAFYTNTFGIPDWVALPTIRKYQRNQLLLKPARPTFSASAQHQVLMGFLDQAQPQPAVMDLFYSFQDGGHSVVAYKAFEIDNDTHIYVYDPNYPYPDSNSPLPKINDDSTFAYSGYNVFNVYPTSPMLDDVVITSARKLAANILNNKNLIAMFARAAGEVVVTNGVGSRIGIFGGVEIREISGAEMWRDGELYLFSLPKSGTYTVTANLPAADRSNTGEESTSSPAGSFDLGYAVPTGDRYVLEVSFNSTNPAGGTYTTQISTSPANVDPLHGPGGQTTAPSLVETERGSIFLDVSSNHWAWNHIESLYGSGITRGCGTDPLMYCPDYLVTRDQMAVFLERGMRGAAYTPPAASGTLFADVPAGQWAAGWIEQFYADGITTGCSTSPRMYCPYSPVTRAQMAVFLLRARHGAAYTPPAAQGIFSDVPTTYWAARWIEQLYAEGITTGCGTAPLRFCPEDAVTRAQMAVFLVRAFGLP